jgi:hypothetical protein
VILLLLSLAMAGGIGARGTRQPLPNREVERPVVLPMGWTSVDVAREGPELSALLRHGVTKRLEFWWRLPGQSWQLGNPSFGGRWLLGKREAPARSGAFELAYTTPGTVTPRLLARQQWGGILFEPQVWSDINVDEVVGHGALQVLLQAGPVAAGSQGSWSTLGTPEISAFVLAQPTRGFDVEVGHRFVARLWTVRMGVRW